MLQLPEFSLPKRAALCTGWNWGILAHLVLMKSMGVFSLLVTPESLWLILTAETHSALEITIQSAMFPKLAFTQAFGCGRRSNWSFLGSVVARKFWGKQREAPVRDGPRYHHQFAPQIRIPGANCLSCSEMDSELGESRLGALNALGLPPAQETLPPPPS